MITTNRREFLAAATAGMAAMAGIGSGPRARAANRAPNIVFILIDDLGWGDVGCYGHEFHETPNIDRLASQGMRFTDAYAACPVCSPTRASILSGQYPARVGITDFITGHWRPYAPLRVPINRTQYLPLEIETMAERLSANGYATGAFGKWHLGGREHFPDSQGFDEFMVHGGPHFKYHTTPKEEVSEDTYLADHLTDKAEAFMEKHRDEPFFLYLSHYAVHIPLQAKQQLIAKYKAKTKPEHGVNHPVYAAMVEHVDNSVGRVMDKLEALGIEEETLVVFFSDNGGLRKRFDEQGDIVSTNAPLRQEKGTVYEGGIRVPLIVRWPGKVKAGTENSTPVTSVDFYPTFCEVSGSAPPEGQVMDGESLMPLLQGSGALERDAIYWHYPHYHHMEPAGVVRSGRWKLVENYETGAAELYDLENDISEAHDKAAEFPDRTQAMREKLALWRTEVNAVMPAPNPDYDPAHAHEWHKHPSRK